MKKNYAIASSIQMDIEEAISLLLSDDHFVSGSTYADAGMASEALDCALDYIKRLKRNSR